MTTIHAGSLPLGTGLLHVPVGRSVAPPGDHLHVMDGDGASLCESVDPGHLVEIYDLRCCDVPISMRCRMCRAIMQVSSAG